MKEIIKETFPEMKNMSFQIEEIDRISRLMSSLIILKFQKTGDKKKILQASWGKKGDFIQSIKNQNETVFLNSSSRS